MKVFIKSNPNHNSDIADVACFLTELEFKVNPAEATTIICESILDTVVDRNAALNKILSRLRYGGRIIMTGVDLEEVSREFVNKTIDVNQAEDLLYKGKQSASTLNTIREELVSRGLTIVNCRITDFHYYILAERNVKS